MVLSTPVVVGCFQNKSADFDQSEQAQKTINQSECEALKYKLQTFNAGKESYRGFRRSATQV